MLLSGRILGGVSMSDDSTSDPFVAMAQKRDQLRQQYKEGVLDTQPFKNALAYLHSIADDLIVAQTYVRIQGARFSAGNDYLLFRFAPQLAESVLSVTMNAREDLQNSARRELRYLLEASVKLSCRDSQVGAQTLDDRLSGLDDRTKRFEDYVSGLGYFEEFEKPEEANAAILSLYSELSRDVHVTVPQLQGVITRDNRGETPGREGVATLNRFNKLAFQVYDLALVRIFYGLGTSLAGDIFTGVLDDEPQWKFHKGKFVGRMSRCFDYKHERQQRANL